MSTLRVALLVLCAAVATQAVAMDDTSLRVTRSGASSVQLTWIDPDPTIFCVRRDAAPPANTVVTELNVTSVIDTPPAGNLWCYSVDEPVNGTCHVETCSDARTIACGDTINARNDDVGSTNGVTTYPGCAVYDATGPEVGYSFTAAADESVTATLTTAGNLVLFLLPDQAGNCDPLSCATSGSTFMWNATAGSVWHLVVDGRGGAASNFTLALTCGGTTTTCTPVGPIACGGTVNGDTSGAGTSSVLSTYAGCGGVGYTGPELIYTFAPPADENVTATLASANASLDVLVLHDTGAGCAASPCVAMGDTQASFAATGGQTYDIVVDGQSGASGTFTLSLACTSPTGPCQPAGVVHCGDTIDGDTTGAGATRALATYAACSASGYDAPEQVWSFTPSTSDTITATLSNLSADFDIIVLQDNGGGCSTATCVAIGDTTTNFAATANQLYYFVVDAKNGATGTYRLAIQCPTAECTPDGALLCGHADAHSNGWPVYSNVIDSYPCAAGVDESGPEYTYSFTATGTGQATATLSNMSADLDLFILQHTNGCTPQDCVTWGDTTATFNIVAGTTYDVVVDGRNGGNGTYRLDLSCNVPPSPCEASSVVRCGDVTGGNNGYPGSTDVIDSYPCSTWDESGPETAFQFAPLEDSNVHVVMDLNTADLDLFILQDTGSGCQPSTCLAYGDQDVSFTAQAGSVYYIVVDGRAGATSDFRLWVDCQPVPGACRAAQTITCGQTVNGNNGAPGSTNTIDQYPNCAAYPETGPEYTYSYVATTTGTIRCTLSNMTADNDIFVLHDTGSGCRAADCVASNNFTVDVPVTAGDTYYIVVEGYTGAVGDYQLTVTCL